MKKVVMLTHDIMIDRRIILEANTLGENGYEVVIIAAPDLNKQDTDHDLNENVTMKRVEIGQIQTSLLKSIKKNKVLKSITLKMISAQNRSIILSKILSIISKINGRSNYLKELYRDCINEDLLNDPLYNRDYSDVYWLSPIYFKYAVEEMADIYHAHDLTMLPTAYKASRLYNAKLVYDSHEYYPEQILAFAPEQEEYANILFEAESKLLPYTNIAITINGFIAEAMAKRYNVPVLNVIQNCAQAPKDLDHNKKYDIIRDKLSLSKDTKIVLFQGSFTEKRNLENLVLSAKYLLNDNIAIVLLGMGGYREILEKIIIENDIPNNKVYFLDAVSQRELIYYTASADIGIIPYIAYNWYFSYSSPNKLYEFIQGALPIIADKDMTEIKRIVEKDNIGFIGDLTFPENIATLINNAISDNELYNTVKNNIRMVHDKYSWETEGAILLELYKTL